MRREHLKFGIRQCRAARALVGWSIDELSLRSGVPQAALAAFEAGDAEALSDDQRQAVGDRFFYVAGILPLFDQVQGEGVRFTRPVAANFRGSDGGRPVAIA